MVDFGKALATAREAILCNQHGEDVPAWIVNDLLAAFDLHLRDLDSRNQIPHPSDRKDWPMLWNHGGESYVRAEDFLRFYNRLQMLDLKQRKEISKQKIDGAEEKSVCAEAYQAVGVMLSDLGIFNTERARKLLDNLSQARKVHDDVLPWDSAQVFPVAAVPSPKNPDGYVCSDEIAFCEGWNACRRAMLAAAERKGNDNG